MSMQVHEVAHCRAGDKGNTSNISVVAFEEKDYDYLRDTLTTERVIEAFAHIAKGPITRYELPNLSALNFVIENALGGGVTVSLAQDIWGKSLSNVMLLVELPDRP